MTTKAGVVLVAIGSVLVLSGCGRPGEECRFDPLTCGGDVGAVCANDADCAHGYCCSEAANCGGGMCTIPCRDDLDCPSFMACEHSVCFFRCERDEDCAAGQGCEHGSTVCEWP